MIVTLPIQADRLSSSLLTTTRRRPIRPPYLSLRDQYRPRPRSPLSWLRRGKPLQPRRQSLSADLNRRAFRTSQLYRNPQLSFSTILEP